VAWGQSREEAIGRMRRALEEYQVLGISTTIPFYQRVMQNAQFIRGNVTTSFIDEIFSNQDLFRNHPMEDLAILAAAIDQFDSQSAAPAMPSGRTVSSWRLHGRKENLR
jgi:acetyl/propionyl-CoA carboxylase alpha subunit